VRIFRKLAQLLDVDLTSTPPADGDALTFDTASSKWVPGAGGGGGGGAPTTADYLVGTANAGLSAEIVVGTSPGGELGGTWASPTVDTVHSGSSHATVQAAAEATAASALSTHASDTTGVHGIADTSALLDTGDIGSTVQARDATLDTYASIDPSANVQSVLSAADYAAIRTLLGLVIGTNVQAFDADLSTWAGLTPSAFFQTLVDDTDAATARATLGVIASLFQSGGAQAIKLDDLAAPDDNTDLNVSTTKHGLTPKLPNDATKYLDGTGAYTVPAGGSGAAVAAAATETGDQTITTGAVTAVTFSTEEYDTDGIHSTSSNTGRLIAPTGLGGKYSVVGNVRWDNSGVGSYRRVRIRVNGTAIVSEEILPVTGGFILYSHCISAQVQLAAGDYVELVVDHDKGSDLAIKGSFAPSRFSMTRDGS
jgi:hypothetical protein